MIENPHLLTDPTTHTHTVVDRRHEQRRGALRFWGGLLMAVAVVMFFLRPELRSVGDPWGFATVLTTAAVGAILIAVGGKPVIEEVRLAEVRVEEGTVEVFAGSSSEFPDLARTIWFEEVARVVFGMTRFPLDGRKGAPNVEAFTVCLHLFDQSVVPIVEATTDKSAGFDIARQLSETLGVPIEQAGLGV